LVETGLWLLDGAREKCKVEGDSENCGPQKGSMRGRRAVYVWCRHNMY
jgi:hypothetical protein